MLFKLFFCLTCFLIMSGYFFFHLEWWFFYFIFSFSFAFPSLHTVLNQQLLNHFLMFCIRCPESDVVTVPRAIFLRRVRASTNRWFKTRGGRQKRSGIPITLPPFFLFSFNLRFIVSQILLQWMMRRVAVAQECQWNAERNIQGQRAMLFLLLIFVVVVLNVSVHRFIV